MTTPPPLPKSTPPPLPQDKERKLTILYAVMFAILYAAHAVLICRFAFTRYSSNAAMSNGYISAGLLGPYVIVGGIASIWKKNRCFSGMIRVLFWTAFILLVSAINQMVNPASGR